LQNAIARKIDGIPEFVDLIKRGTIVGSGMQQPYLMGQRSTQAILDHLSGKKTEKEILVPIEVMTQEHRASRTQHPQDGLRRIDSARAR
jgi:ABC-type sugar transport system substrate-binding protein